MSEETSLPLLFCGNSYRLDLPEHPQSSCVYRYARAMALALAAALVSMACGGGPAGQVGASASASPAPAAGAATADCLALGAVAAVTVPPLEVRDQGDGTKRITSAEGGYEVTVPSSWLVSGNFAGQADPAFAQAHLTSYDPRTAPAPRPEAGGILPPEVGIRFDVEMWANPWKEAPDVYARRLHIGPDQAAVLPGASTMLNGVRAYRTSIQDERRFQPATGPLITTRQTRAVWLVPSPRDDRMLVFYATPAESPLLAAVERAMSTLQVTPPAKAVRPVTHQRSEILQKWLTGKSGPIAGRRAEAKLMSYAEASVALSTPQGASPATPMGILRIDHDPEDLFWLVAVSGPDLPQPRGGPMVAGTAAPTAWILFNAPATDGPPASTGMSISSSGAWPPGFDALPDRCR